MPHRDPNKDVVRDFWDQSPCGETYISGSELRTQFESQASARYSLEPYIEPFAAFESAAGRDVLEIGVGMGTDHLRLARSAPNSLAGVDLSPHSVRWTKQRLDTYGFASNLQIADAEDLPFPNDSFSLVYSWGVIHHSPDTKRAVSEIYRVLKPGGQARVMIYHRRSLVGYALWLRYALLAGKPWQSLDSVYAEHLESRGTKAYSVDSVRELFSDFSDTSIRVQLSFADMMRGNVGQRHGARLVALGKALWPRKAVARFLGSHGLYLLVKATK